MEQNNGYNLMTLIKEGLPLHYISKLVYGDNTPESITPDKNVLKTLLQKKQSFKTIAAVIRVPEKTVKQWCKQYDLPTNLKDLKRYIKEKM